MKEREYTDLFERLCKAKNWHFRSATKDEDMKKHIDGHVTIYDKGKALCTFSVDLKGDKYMSRADNGDRTKLCQYVEFLNVNGDRGWLFGEAKFIAILNEEQDGFYFVNRLDLIDYIEKLLGVPLSGSLADIRRCLESVGCELNLWVSHSSVSMHKLYKRHDRPDECVTQINMDDVKACCKMRI